MVLRTEPFDGGRKWNPLHPALRSISLGNVELTFLGHPLESLGRAFDPVLAVIAVGRKQPDHLIGAAGSWTRDIGGSNIDGLSNGEFVFQRPLHTQRYAAVPTVPLASANRKT